MTKEVAMTIRKRRSDRSVRGPLLSPGRPPVAGRDERRRFWAAIAAGMASEVAAIGAGVPQAVGTRWFRKAGGMPPARDCQEFRARLSGLTDQSMAAVKRSPKRTANCDLAMDHSRGGMIHSFSERFKTRKRSLVAASSLGKWPLARTARRSLALSASIAFV